MGMERLVLLMLEAGVAAPVGAGADVYAVAVGDAAQLEALAAVQSIRGKLANLAIVQHTGGGSFKSQLKRADKSGARVALIWGEDEVRTQTVTVKMLREGEQGGQAGQQSVPRDQLEATLSAVFAD
jgi:histidyl-tRNA synthetase